VRGVLWRCSRKTVHFLRPLMSSTTRSAQRC
jgi:hypothetical protein